ncbi:hypothetical protein ABK040_013928 [Willaertia magna]
MQPSSSSTPTSSDSSSSGISSMFNIKNVIVALGASAAAAVGFVIYKILAKNKTTKTLAKKIETESKKTNITVGEQTIKYLLTDAKLDSSWKEFSQKKIGVTFKIPNKLEPEVATQGSVNTITLIDPSEINPMTGQMGDGSATMVTVEEANTDAKTYLKQNLSQIQQTNVPFKILEEKEVKVNGLDAAQMAAEITGQQTVRMFSIAIKSPHENKVFMVQHIATNMKKYDQKIEELKNIVRTLKIEKGESYGKVFYTNVKRGFILPLPNPSYFAIKSKQDLPTNLKDLNVECYLVNYTKEDKIEKEICIISNEEKLTFEEFVEKQKVKISQLKDFNSVGNLKVAGVNAVVFKYISEGESIPVHVVASKEGSSMEKSEYEFIEMYLQKDGVNYIVTGRALPEVSSQFSVEALTSMKSLKFIENLSISEDQLTYENSEFNFKICQPVKLQATIKENASDNPICTMLVQNDESGMPLETLVATVKSSPIIPIKLDSLNSLEQMVKSEIQMLQMYTGGHSVAMSRDKKLKINGFDAFQIVYSMLDPMTGENLVIHQTGLMMGENAVILKSYIYQQVYNDKIGKLFDEIHSNFVAKK